MPPQPCGRPEVCSIRTSRTQPGLYRINIPLAEERYEAWLGGHDPGDMSMARSWDRVGKDVIDAGLIDVPAAENARKELHDAVRAQRLADGRKGQSVTQMELAKSMDISQAGLGGKLGSSRTSATARSPFTDEPCLAALLAGRTLTTRRSVPGAMSVPRFGEQSIDGELQYLGPRLVIVLRCDEVAANQQRVGQHAAGLDIVLIDAELPEK